jgi:hypothetical protein
MPKYLEAFRRDRDTGGDEVFICVKIKVLA